MHSDYFKRLCEGHFRESGERKAELHGDSLASVNAMIDYMYTFDYAEPDIRTTLEISDDDEAAEPHSVVELHSHMFTLADKYNLPALKNMAIRKAIRHAKGQRGAIITPLFLSRLADEFIPATRHAYKYTPATDVRMRTKMCWFWNVHTTEGSLLGQVDKAAFHALVAEVPDFAIDLMSQMKNIAIGDSRQEG